DNVSLSCNYSGTVRSLQWYRQYPGSKPEFLIMHIETKSESKLRLYAVADKGIKRMNLTISSTHVDDSALYYCALEPTVTGNTVCAVQKPDVSATNINMLFLSRGHLIMMIDISDH
ncbi:hypothetical protein DPX16_18223, partial [Anabarilius grahami]